MEMVYCIEPRILLSQLRLYKWLSLTIAISIVPLPLDNGVTHQDAKLQMGLKPGALFKIGCRRHGRCYQDQAMLHPQSLYWRGDVTNGDRMPLADILRIPKERVDMDCPSKTSTIISVDTKEKLIKFWSPKTKL